MELSTKMAQKVGAGDQTQKCIAFRDKRHQSAVEDLVNGFDTSLGRNGLEPAGHRATNGRMEFGRVVVYGEQQIRLVQHAHAAILLNDWNL